MKSANYSTLRVRVVHLNGVSDGPDAGVVGAEVVVDDDAAPRAQLEPRILRQLLRARFEG